MRWIGLRDSVERRQRRGIATRPCNGRCRSSRRGNWCSEVTQDADGGYAAECLGHDAGRHRRGIVAEISGATIWRWLDQDAIRPWQFRGWISSPRDPRFEEKAGPLLDLYQGLWRGVPLHPDDLVICADEKPSIQARQRKRGRILALHTGRGLP